MVLVDSSVWLRFFRNRVPYAEHLTLLIRSGLVAGHDLVYGELLIGDPGGRRDMEGYGRLPQIPDVPHRQVVEFVQVNKLHGVGIGWIDAHLLASAKTARVQFWTVDTALAACARRFNLIYEP